MIILGHQTSLKYNLKNMYLPKSTMYFVIATKLKAKFELTSHFHMYTGYKTYRYETFSKMFLRKSDLNRHILSHTIEKTYTCTACFQ